MSAMRVFTKEAFYQKLREYGFYQTEQATPDHTLWHHKESDKFFSVPHHAEDGIPDFVLDEYLSAVDKLYEAQDGEDCGKKDYQVKQRNPALKVVD